MHSPSPSATCTRQPPENAKRSEPFPVETGLPPSHPVRWRRGKPCLYVKALGASKSSPSRIPGQVTSVLVLNPRTPVPLVSVPEADSGRFSIYLENAPSAAHE